MTAGLGARGAPVSAVARRFPSSALGGAALVLVVAPFAAVLATGAGGHRVVDYIDDTVTPVAAALAALFCVRAGLRQEGGTRRFWLLLGGASVVWTAAETIWAVYELVLGVPVPDPSWADVGYLSAILVAVAALLSHPALRGASLRGARAILEGAILATSLLFLSWSLVLERLWHHTDLSSSAGVVAVAYPFSDVILVFLVVQAIRAINVTERLALWCVLAGIVAMAFSDTFYTYFTETSSYATGNLIDAGWVAAYLGLALGGFVATNERAVVARRPLGHLSATSLVASVVPVLVALGVTAVRTSLGHGIDRASWLLALVLCLLVLVRLAMVLFEQALGAPRHGYQLDRLLAAERPFDPAARKDGPR